MAVSESESPSKVLDGFPLILGAGDYLLYLLCSLDITKMSRRNRGVANMSFPI